MIRSRARNLIWVLFFVVATLSGSVLFLRSKSAADLACTLARRNLPLVLGLDVSIGRCELLPFQQTVKLHGVGLFERGNDEPTLALDLLEVSLRAVHPYVNRIELNLLRAVRPRLRLGARASSPTGGAGGTTCPFDLLRRVGLRTLDVRGAEVELRTADSLYVRLSGLDITAEDGHFDIRLKEGVAARRSGAKVPIYLGASGFFETRRLSLKVSSAFVASADTQVWVRGDVIGVCDPTFALEGDLDSKLTPTLSATAPELKALGRVSAHLKLSGTRQNPVCSASAQGEGVAIGGLKPGNFKARLSYRKGELTLEDSELEFGPGVAMVAGSMRLGGNFPTKVRLSVRDAQFGRILDAAGVPGAWIDFLATGKAELSGPLLPRPALVGSADIKGNRLVVAARPFDAPPSEGQTIIRVHQAHVYTGVKILYDRVDFVDAKLSGPHSQAGGNVSIFYDPTKGLSAEGYGEPLELEDFEQIAGLGWSGTAFTKFFIGGPFGKIGVKADIRARDFSLTDIAFGNLDGKLSVDGHYLNFTSLVAHKGKTTYYGDATLRFAPGPLHLAAHATVPSGRAEDVLDVIAGLHPAIAHFQGDTTGQISGQLKLESPASALDGSANITLTDTQYLGRRLGNGRASLKFVRGEAIRVEEAALAGPAGAVKLLGVYPFHGDVEMKFEASGVSAAEWVGDLLPQRTRVDANAIIAGTITGTGDHPAIDATVVSSDVSIGKYRLGEMRLATEIRGRELRVGGPLFPGADLRLGVTLAQPFPYQCKITLSLSEIRPFLAEIFGAQGTSGVLQGQVSLQGRLRELGTSTGTATFPLLTVSRGDFSGANDGPIRLSIRERQIKVESFEFKGPNTQMKLVGGIAPDIDASVRGSLDMRLVESLIPYFERSAGRLEFSAVATGTVDHPRLVGSAEIANARLALKDQPVTIRNLGGRLEFSETRILLEDFRGNANEGRVSAHGNVALGNSGIGDVEVEVQLEEISLRIGDDVPVAMSGLLLLHGKPEFLALSGDLDVLRLKYDQPIEVEKSLLRFPKSSAGAGIGQVSALRLDIGIHSKGNVRVDNNVGRAKVLGDVRLTGTAAQTGMIGVLQAEPGSQLFFRGNQFTITQASMEFKERTRIEPLVDVQAQTQVREYLVRLHAFGKVTQPNLILTAEPPLSEADVLSLLTLGVTSKDNSSVARAGAGLAVEALFNASGLDQQIQKFLPKTQVFRDLSLRLSTGYNDVTGLVEPTAQVESRFLTEQLKLRGSQPISGRGRKAQAEYRFHDRLSAQAQWDNESSDYSFGNFGLLLRMHLESR